MCLIRISFAFTKVDDDWLVIKPRCINSGGYVAAKMKATTTVNGLLGKTWGEYIFRIMLMVMMMVMVFVVVPMVI